MPKKPINLNLKTPQADLCKEELNKINKEQVFKQLKAEFRNDLGDLTWEAEALAKSCGIYLEFNRALTGEEKDWIYMIRVGLPGGGPVTREQWQLFDQLADKYTKNPDGIPSLRLTNRQAVQFHWVKKDGVIPIVKSLAEKGFNSLNACGDNTRNVLGCPLSNYSDLFNASAWARKAGSYFQLPLAPFIEIFTIDPKFVRTPEQSFEYGPQLLNRKFKIAFSTVHRDFKTGKIIGDNCVELLTHDMSVAPIVENNKVAAFQIYIGGGQGERNGKPAMATLGQPLCITTEDKLLKVMDTVVKVHQEWGDRQNRVWARLKYVVKKQGIPWYFDQVKSHLNFSIEKPNPDHNYGDRDLHFGWHEQPSNKLLARGVFIENGRLIDNSINGKLKAMTRDLMNKYPIQLMVTPNQDLLFVNIPPAMKIDFDRDLESYGWGKRNNKEYSPLRLHSGACVGRDTCRLTYTDSEQFEPELIDQLEQMGWGDLAESIGITGCERQCFRPGTKTIGLVGSGMDRYMFKLFGDETGRFQGRPLIGSDVEKMYLRSIERNKVAIVIDALFKYYKENAQAGEKMGAFNRRVGADAIISYLKSNSATASLMEKPFPTDCVIE